jgi:hypothetical protein
MAKADKLRDCPAVGRKITAPECGSNRGTRYDCPPDCPYCPWTVGNYDQLLEISRKFDGKLMDFYGKTVGAPSVLQRLRPQEVKSDLDEMELMQRCHLEFYQREIRPGKKLFDLWRESAWSGLRNDEILLAGFAPQTQATVFEVRRVLDDLRCECADVLAAGATFTVCDRALAEMARQYQAFCGWLVPSPFFQRLYGVAFPLSLSPESARATVLRHVEKLGGPLEGKGDMTEWLGENFSFFVESVSEESAKRFERIWRNLDAKQCVANYHFNGTADDLGLAGREDFDETPPSREEVEARGPHRCFVWLRTGSSQAWERELPEALQQGGIGPGQPMWGQLRVFPGRVEISAMSSMHFEPMKKMVEEFFGDRLEFEKEFVADLAKQIAAGGRVADRAARPATSELAKSPEGAELLQSVMRSHYEKFLREPVPALDGLTPREAAARPEMRPRLVALMKGHLQSVDDLGRRQGIAHDIGWVLGELGLDELLSAPRPPRPAGSPRQGAWWKVLTIDEVEAAIKGMAKEDRMLPGRCPPGLREYFQDADERLDLQAAEVAVLLTAVDIVIGALVPRGCAAPDIDYDVIAAESEHLLLGVYKADDKTAYVGDLIESSSQPYLFSFLMSFVVSTGLGEEKDLKPLGPFRPGAVDLLAIEIEALIRCLRRAALT